jgi:hypothetical protein
MVLRRCSALCRRREAGRHGGPGAAPDACSDQRGTGARDQAADDTARRGRLPRQVAHSEDAVGPVQRHWLAERTTDDCPRCGWRGYVHHYGHLPAATTYCHEL